MTDIDLLSEPAVHRSALVAREFVHRLAPSQVLLTEVRPAGHDEYRAVVHWPRARPAHEPSATRPVKPDPLMVAETLRQLGVFLPLRYYGVDPASRLVIEELSFTLDSAAEPEDHPTGTEITCTAQVRRAGAAVSGPPHSLALSVEFSARSGSAPFARADGIARVLSLAAYRAVRNRRKLVREETEGEAGPDPASLIEPVAPERVGMFGPHEVLVALDEQGAVRIAPADPHHPFLHDHPSDHITGVTLISAVRQAAALQRGAPELRMISCALKATRFTEPDPPATIEVDESGRFEIRQEGTVTASGQAGFENAEDIEA
ncbi:AfsA-related hotdog domain-containing protein [Actinospica robiniae]|uniref:AfsA-related hotdog domain-containing protein n=1 Tax=Actinospica robiniae TaxID=304901 RepID=UPI0004019D5F|nr:AfsA-related hotdog domain-containing protein [Actinospica robiniae]